MGIILAAGSIGASSTPFLTRICQIQGAGFTSPLEGASVQTQGVVSADFDDVSIKGFFLQAPNCNSNPATSDWKFALDPQPSAEGGESLERSPAYIDSDSAADWVIAETPGPYQIDLSTATQHYPLPL